MTMNQQDFGQGALPRFWVDAVSTGSGTCRFDVGAKQLVLVISSGGVRTWGSGDCARGQGRQTAELARGIPLQRGITWGRLTSAPGCRLPRTPALPGTYTATAFDSGLHSQTLVFVLS
jgi:hypothetical protein